ncbi:MAG: type I methionyl aminopeptidase [Clostridiales bacterium]|nr:type I methionyl aminopeptidase [Clostridiales bacterium]
MIALRTDNEIERMALAGRLTAECMQEIAPMIRPGVSTAELDRAAKRFIVDRGGRPSFLGYHGYPASLCASVNEEVVHGIPGPRRLREGDIVGIDLGVILDGYQGDMARTFAVGAVSDAARALIDAAHDSFEAALAVMIPGNRLGDIGHAVQTLAESRGYGVVRELCGHGIGHDMHEDPEVPNYGQAGRGLRLRPGMVLAVEPMINAGTWRVKFLDDGWTVVTGDGSLSAHWENTVAVTADGPRILTAADS